MISNVDVTTSEYDDNRSSNNNVGVNENRSKVESKSENHVQRRRSSSTTVEEKSSSSFIMVSSPDDSIKNHDEVDRNRAFVAVDEKLLCESSHPNHVITSDKRTNAVIKSRAPSGRPYSMINNATTFEYDSSRDRTTSTPKEKSSSTRMRSSSVSNRNQRRPSPPPLDKVLQIEEQQQRLLDNNRKSSVSSNNDLRSADQSWVHKNTSALSGSSICISSSTGKFLYFVFFYVFFFF